jgi:hypothetical protein
MPDRSVSNYSIRIPAPASPATRTCNTPSTAKAPGAPPGLDVASVAVGRIKPSSVLGGVVRVGVVKPKVGDLVLVVDGEVTKNADVVSVFVSGSGSGNSGSSGLSPGSGVGVGDLLVVGSVSVSVSVSAGPKLVLVPVMVEVRVGSISSTPPGPWHTSPFGQQPYWLLEPSQQT